MKETFGLFRLVAAATLLALALAGCEVDPPAAATTREPEPVPSETFTLFSPSPSLKSTEPRPPAIPVRGARVTRIIDGDTIEVRLGDDLERVRLIGIDTPERGDNFFDEASAYTANVADVGRAVYLELDVDHRDRYGRLLAYVWLSRPSSRSSARVRDDMVNARILLKGWATTLTIQPNSQYADLFARYQDEGCREQRGLCAPAPKPTPTSSSRCHPGYSGKCLKPDSPDYDCAGGSGNGPDYVEGPVYIEGDDPYELDRDGDGVACE